jgi:hypothetical protein
MRGVDETGAVDLDIQAGNDELYKTALLIYINKTGGRLRVTPREIQLMPPGSLAYAMEEEVLVFAYTREPLNADIEQFAASLPDTAIVAANNLIIRQTLSIVVINAGGTLALHKEDLAAVMEADWNLRFESSADGGHNFWLERAS